MNKHPDMLSDTDLDSWIVELVNNKEPENIRLDYKQILKLSPDTERRELAKDITSFANEVGGTLIYGVPEQSNPAGPIPSKPYGIDPIPGAEASLENIFVTTISPTLPEYRIRRINLSEYPGKVVYIVWVPESWTGPHMVHGYAEGRYYRRGQYRSILMSERDVEQRYNRRVNLIGLADKFMDSTNATHLSKMFPSNIAKTSTIILPELLYQNRIDFSLKESRVWLENNLFPLPWVPSMFGVTTSVDRGRASHVECEIHRNGAIVEWHQTKIVQDSPPVLAYLSELQNLLTTLQLASRWFNFLSYSGPLKICLKIYCPPAYALFLPIAPDRSIPLEPSGTSVEVTIEPSSLDLMNSTKSVLKQLADGIFRNFGIWEAQCFDKDLNLQLK